MRKREGAVVTTIDGRPCPPRTEWASSRGWTRARPRARAAGRPCESAATGAPSFLRCHGVGLVRRKRDEFLDRACSSGSIAGYRSVSVGRPGCCSLFAAPDCFSSRLWDSCGFVPWCVDQSTGQHVSAPANNNTPKAASILWTRRRCRLRTLCDGRSSRWGCEATNFSFPCDTTCAGFHCPQGITDQSQLTKLAFFFEKEKRSRPLN